MKQMRRINIPAIILMIIALAAPVVLAQSTDNPTGKEKYSHSWRGARRGHHGHGKHEFALFSKLNLTDAQKEQMKQLRESRHESLKPLFEQIRAKRQEIRQSSDSGTFNEAFVTQKMTEIAVLEAKLMGEQFKMKQETMNLLTPEQKEKMEQLRQEFKQKGHGRRNK